MNRILPLWILPTAALSFLIALPVRAQLLYSPIPIPPDNSEIRGSLTTEDIPTGEGGFARDYTVTLTEGEQIAIDLSSEEFDTIVILIASDGTTVAQNDDGPDGSTNSLLFTRVPETGRYIVRVRAFGDTGGGDYVLKFTKLQPVDNP